VTDLLGSKALVASAHSFSQTLGEAYRLVDRFGWLVGLAALGVAAVGLLRVVSTNLWERRHDIGVMRAVGWRRSDIVWQLAGEVVALVFAGVGVGLVGAIGISWVLSQTSVTVPVPWELSPTPHFLPGGAKAMALIIPLPAHISPATAFTAVALGVVGSATAAIALAVWTARIKPAEVLRSE
jgi:putative ABC transport system permease protein